jgi:hypothetical protein
MQIFYFLKNYPLFMLIPGAPVLYALTSAFLLLKSHSRGQILAQIGVAQFFFSQPKAGLTNQPPVRDFQAGAPLPQRRAPPLAEQCGPLFKHFHHAAHAYFPDHPFTILRCGRRERHFDQ